MPEAAGNGVPDELAGVPDKEIATWTPVGQPLMLIANGVRPEVAPTLANAFLKAVGSTTVGLVAVHDTDVIVVLPVTFREP